MPRPGLYRIGIILPLISFAATAAPGDYEGRPVVAIDFSPEKQPYSREYLYEILPVKVNEALRSDTIRAAIERLYATGRYSDIAVDARPSGNGAQITFITKANYFIGRITVDRVSPPPNEGVLINTTRLGLGTLYTPEATTQAVTNIRDVLRNNGFYETRVEPEYDYEPATQQVNIRFRVTTTNRARYETPEVTGNLERPPREIVKATHWKGWLGWKKVTEARTQDGVKRVRQSYQKEDRLEARVALDNLNWNRDTNRVKPTLNVDAGPRIRVEVTGAKLSRGKMRQMIPVYEEQSVDRDLLVEAANNLKEYFEGQGYFHTDVEFTTRNTGKNEEVIQFTVQRGDRHRVALVSVSGNKYFDTNTIRERMYVRPAGFLQLRHGRYSDAFLARDVDAISSLYRSNGFRDVKVDSRVVHGYGGKETDIAVYIDINEGPQWLVANLDLRGVSEANREAVENVLQSTPGQPFSDLNLTIDRDNVLDYYFNNGYVNATLQWSFSPAKEPARMDVQYIVSEGSRRLVRDVLISGLEATDPALVDERILVNSGDPLSRSRLLDTQRRLYDLGIFTRVDMALQDPGAQERDKYVLLDFEEARKYTVTGGIGAEIAKIGGCASCLDQPAGRAGFSPRAYFGLTRRNFLGNGHIISFQSRASTLEQRGVLSYQAPQFRGSPNINLLFSGVYDDSRDVNTFTARRREGSVQVGQKLSKASTMLYRFSYRRVSVADVVITPELIPLFSQPARIGAVGGNYIQDRRDDPLDSHRGIYNTLDFSWASHAFGSQAEFTHFLSHNATYHPIGLGSRYVLARSLTFGWLQTLGHQEIPLPERFFAGGATSHRGFPENQAGPRDLETGFPLGGKALLLNQLELRFPLLGENIRGVLFEDAGNVYSGLDKISLRTRQHSLSDFNYMVHALGFGVRYRTPVGPVRLDLAYTVNPPNFFGCHGTIPELLHGCPDRREQSIGHFQFHFSLGQAF